MRTVCSRPANRDPSSAVLRAKGDAVAMVVVSRRVQFCSAPKEHQVTKSRHTSVTRHIQPIPTNIRVWTGGSCYVGWEVVMSAMSLLFRLVPGLDFRRCQEIGSPTEPRSP